MKVLKRLVVTGMLLLTLPLCIYAQSILNKNISIQVSRQRLDNVLEILSNKGDFYFSYNSNIVKGDSLVTLTVYNKTVKQVLDLLFSDEYEFKESGNYIIIRRTPVKVALVTSSTPSDDKIYIVSGFVVDNETGEKVTNASVYEKKLLVSALTDDNGYFKIKLKSRNSKVALTVSKEWYQDTTIRIEPKYHQQLTITVMPLEQNRSIVTVSPEDLYAPDSLKLRLVNDSITTEYLYVKKDSMKIEKTAAGIFLLSSKQKIQSLNLSKYFTERPFPGIAYPGS